MAKLTSKDLEKRIDEISGKLEAYRIKNAESVLDGKADRDAMNEIASLERELASTKDAVTMARQREAEEAERLQIERQEKAKSDAGKLRAKATEQLEDVIDQVLATVESSGVFLDTLQKGKDTLYNAGLGTGEIMRDSEYFEVINNVIRLARGLHEVHPKRAYPGHPDLSAELEPFVKRFERKF